MKSHGIPLHTQPLGGILLDLENFAGKASPVASRAESP